MSNQNQSPAGIARCDPREDEALRLIKSGSLTDAESLVTEILQDHPDNPLLLNTVGMLAAQQGKFSHAFARFDAALDLDPHDQAILANVAAAKADLSNRAHQLLWQGKGRAALRAFREVLRFDPDNTWAHNTIIHLIRDSGEKPRLSDFAPDLDPNAIGEHIVIACMPKSGSTFLNQAITHLTGYEQAQLTFAYLQNENELYLPHLRAVAERNTVTQIHCRATEANIQLLQAFGIRPIVQMRSLYDLVVSYTDFWDKGATKNTFFAGRWDSFERADKFDIIIDNWIPWYLAFYVSWMDVIRDKRLECHIVRYEDMVDDKSNTLAQIAGFYGLSQTLVECVRVVESVDGQGAQTRLNKGIVGRGNDQLTDAQKDRIRRLASYYPDVDFGLIGISG